MRRLALLLAVGAASAADWSADQSHEAAASCESGATTSCENEVHFGR